MLLAMCLSGEIAAEQNPADRLLDEQRALRREQQMEHGAPAVRPDARPLLQSDPAQLVEHGPALQDAHIVIDSHGLLDAAALEHLVAPFRAQPLGTRRLDLLLRRLDARLVEAGWITSRARLVAFDEKTSLVSIELLPGRVERLQANGLDGPLLERVVPVAAGDVLSLEALEQGVQQINRLRMYQAQVRILPGSVVGTSLLDILLSEGRPWSMSAGLDNQGARSTGAGRLRFGGRIENAFGQLDDLQFAYVHSARSDALLASIAVPAGFNTWSATISGSRSSTDLLGLDFTTRSLTAVVSWNRVLSLSKEGRDALDISLARSRLARKIDDTDLATERSTVLRAAWTHIGRGAAHQYYIEPAAVFGLPWFGATPDASALPSTHTHHAFAKWAISAGGVARDSSGRFEYAGQFAAQRARESLIGAEQLQLGGLASVRGFDESVAAGDKGYLLRTELRFPDLFAQVSSSPVPFLHADQGATRLIGGRRNTLASLGAGVRGSGHGAVWEGVLSLPVRREAGTPGHGWYVHFSLAFEI